MFVKYSCLCMYIIFHFTFTNLFLREKSTLVIPAMNFQVALHWSSTKNSFLADNVTIEYKNNQIHILLKEPKYVVTQTLNRNDTIKIVRGEKTDLYRIIDITSTSTLHTLITAENSGKLIKKV